MIKKNLHTLPDATHLVAVRSHPPCHAVSTLRGVEVRAVAGAPSQAVWLSRTVRGLTPGARPPVKAGALVRECVAYPVVGAVTWGARACRDIAQVTTPAILTCAVARCIDASVKRALHVTLES